MASIGLRGQNEYAYCTTNSILWGVFETKFCFKSYGLGVKVEHTDRQTDSFRLYIYRYHKSWILKSSYGCDISLGFCYLEQCLSTVIYFLFLQPSSRRSYLGYG